jgi:hypothetical protein
MRAVPAETVLEVRYEELLRYPETILARVCAFIGETFHDEMLQYSKHADALVPSWEKRWHARLSGPVDSSNTGKWRTQLSPEQIALIQHVAGRELAAFGYDLVPIALTPTAAARLQLDCAHHHALRAAGWAMRFVRGSQPMSRTALRPAERES